MAESFHATFIARYGAAISLFVLVGCTTVPSIEKTIAVSQPAATETPATTADLLFSTYPATAHQLPAELKRWALPGCPQTEYELVQQGDHTVLHAKALSSASSIRKEVAVEPTQFPALTWRWKTNALIPEADNTLSYKEDSPARIILTFDGDREKLSFGELARSQLLKVLTGEELPFATLMYIWENRLPVGTIINSSHSSRIKMIVATSGPQQVGQWVQLSRNMLEDYRRAFGEAPGKLVSIGVMTDSNKTASQAEAYYGDIHLLPSDSLVAQEKSGQSAPSSQSK